MNEMKIANVFVNKKGQFGNPVGIIIDTNNDIDKNQRQQMARKSGFSEIVFINNLDTKEISIYSPQREIPFAGHAVVGTVYLLNYKYNLSISEVTGIGGKIKTWQENDLTWVRSKLEILPSWNYEQLDNSAEVDKISTKEALLKKHTFVWAWIDKDKGVIRARTFAADWGIPEDEANGSGAMKLASQLNRELEIHHGKGSIIYSKSCGSGCAEVGGLVNIL